MQEWVVEAIGLGVTILMTLVGGLVWGVRLEGLVKQNTKDIDRMDDAHRTLLNKHENLEQKIIAKISDVVETLARIEERLKSRE